MSANYKEGLDSLKTSCLSCKFKPDYTSAIPCFKLAADEFHNSKNFKKEIECREQLIKCLKKTDSPWEEGNEYEKISNLQLTQFKSPGDAYISIENAFNAYVNDSKYDYSLKSVCKASENFLDNEYKTEAEKCLEFAFKGINKYYDTIISKETHPSYIYDTIDRYIDLLYNGENYKKGAEISKKSAELIQSENKEEKYIIGKYYSFQAIGELSRNNKEGYKKAIEKGMKAEKGENGLSNKVNKLVNTVNEKNEDNNKLISSLFNDIESKLPNSISKMLNKYIKDNQDNKGNKEKDKHIRFLNEKNNNNINNYSNEKNEEFTDFEEDLK